MRGLPAVPDLAVALEEFKATASASFGARLQRMVLFGSVARCRMSEESDVDVLLVIDPWEEDDVTVGVDAAVSVKRPRMLPPNEYHPNCGYPPNDATGRLTFRPFGAALIERGARRRIG